MAYLVWLIFPALFLVAFLSQKTFAGRVATVLYFAACFVIFTAVIK